MDGKTIDRRDLQALVCASLREVLSSVGGEKALAAATEQTPLFGSRGILDSMGLATLIIDVEQKINERYALAISLADDRAMSQKNSPFRTVQTLTDYIQTLITQ